MRAKPASRVRIPPSPPRNRTPAQAGVFVGGGGSDVPAHVAIGIRRAGPASPAGVEEPSGARRGDRIPPSGSHDRIGHRRAFSLAGAGATCLRTSRSGFEAARMWARRREKPLRLRQNKTSAFHHVICKSAFILALTCSMTSALTVAFFLARRIFQSRDFT